MKKVRIVLMVLVMTVVLSCDKQPECYTCSVVCYEVGEYVTAFTKELCDVSEEELDNFIRSYTYENMATGKPYTVEEIKRFKLTANDVDCYRE